MTTTTMQATAAAKFNGPFAISYAMTDGTPRTRTATWRALQSILPALGHLADAGRLHSIMVLGRHGNDVTFSSDVLPLMEDVTVSVA